MSTLDVFPITLNGIKVTLLKCDEKLILVDTGLNPGHAEAILSYARDRVGTPLETHGEVCIITHNHRDHVGGLKTLAAKCRFKVASQIDEADAIEATTGIKVEIRLRDRETLPGYAGIRIVHVPGHTVGNACVYIEAKRLLISGDTLNTDERGELNPPADRYNVDTAMAKEELKRLLELDFERIIVSHGKDIDTDGKKRLEDLLNQLKP